MYMHWRAFELQTYQLDDVPIIGSIPFYMVPVFIYVCMCMCMCASLHFTSHLSLSLSLSACCRSDPPYMKHHLRGDFSTPGGRVGRSREGRQRRTQASFSRQGQHHSWTDRHNDTFNVAMKCSGVHACMRNSVSCGISIVSLPVHHGNAICHPVLSTVRSKCTGSESAHCRNRAHVQAVPHVQYVLSEQEIIYLSEVCLIVRSVTKEACLAINKHLSRNLSI
jgi:hypothetical protein